MRREYDRIAACISASVAAPALRPTGPAASAASPPSSNLSLSGPRGAAVRLGINRSTLQFRMKKLGIERPLIANNEVSA